MEPSICVREQSGQKLNSGFGGSVFKSALHCLIGSLFNLTELQFPNLYGMSVVNIELDNVNRSKDLSAFSDTQEAFKMVAIRSQY